jgi:hypothetical protein
MRLQAGMFQPEELALLRAVIDDAAAMVPEAQRPPEFEERLARRILADASGHSGHIASPLSIEMIALLALAEVMKTSPRR